MPYESGVPSTDEFTNYGQPAPTRGLDNQGIAVGPDGLPMGRIANQPTLEADQAMNRRMDLPFLEGAGQPKASELALMRGLEALGIHPSKNYVGTSLPTPGMFDPLSPESVIKDFARRSR